MCAFRVSRQTNIGKGVVGVLCLVGLWMCSSSNTFSTGVIPPTGRTWEDCLRPADQVCRTSRPAGGEAARPADRPKRWPCFHWSSRDTKSVLMGLGGSRVLFGQEMSVKKKHRFQKQLIHATNTKKIQKESQKQSIAWVFESPWMETPTVRERQEI